MAGNEFHIDTKITFHQPWARAFEWIENQHTRFQSLRNEWRKRRNYRADLRRLLATGPHLHYEFVVNGVHRNPRTVSLPKVEPLKGETLKAFQVHAAPMLTQLSRLESASLYAKRD